LKKPLLLYEKLSSGALKSIPTAKKFQPRVSTQFKFIQTLWLVLLLGSVFSLYDNLDSTAIGIMAAAVVLYLCGFFWIQQQVIVPLREMALATKSIANGDLNTRIKVDKPGALGESQLGLDMIRARIKATIGRIQEASSGMATATSQLASMSQETNDSMQHQMMETEMIATAMQEMAATVQEVAGNTSTAADAANQAQYDSRQGHSIVEKNMGSINDLSSKIGSVEEAIQSLNRDSEDIGSILEVIRGVAEQTNLLALNAAIEAARAGDQGRGFAVVADEVRALAMRVQSSTDEIHGMIEKLQAGAAAAVQAMISSRESALHSVGEAQEAGEALGRIQDSVLVIQDLSTQIATAAEQQSSVSEEMSRNVVGISDHSATTAAAATEAAEACLHLVDAARRLDLLTHDYDV